MAQKKQNLTEIIIDVFKLSDPDVKTEFLKEIRSMSEDKNYKEACVYASCLNLHTFFDIHEFVVPLILQDRANLVEDYIKDSPELQKSTVQYLDGLFDGGNENINYTLHEYVRSRQIPNVKSEKLHHKPISKLVKRLASKFKMHEFSPNVGDRQRFGELRHLFSRRYEKQEMSAESFEELINQIAEGNQKMKEEILNHYMMYYDFQSAAQYITLHNLYNSPYCTNDAILSRLPEPHRCRLFQQNLSAVVTDECWDDEETVTTPRSITTSNVVVHQDECWDTDESIYSKTVEPAKRYYMYPLLKESIHIIDNLTKFQELCACIDQVACTTNGTPISGFDSEWKPILNKTEGAALLQIAFTEMTFIVDIVSLKNNPDTSVLWSRLRKCYFENEKVLKLGYDVKNDIRKLETTVPEWEGMSDGLKLVCDLCTVKSLVMKARLPFFEGVLMDAKTESGLSELVFLCLGQALSKEEQMSDWEKRPLRESQILYAAGDAYCLIDVYNKMMELKDRSNLDFSKIIRDSMKQSSSTSSTRKRKSPVEMVLELMSAMKEVPPQSSSTIFSSCDKVRLVVDNMFQGLGRYLRAIGFDTILIDCGQRHSHCCKYAKEQDRVIITKGVAYDEIMLMLDPEVSKSLVYCVTSEKTLEQLEEICRYLHVTPTYRDLFSVCQICNSNRFIKVLRDRILEAMDAQGIRSNKRRITGESTNMEYVELIQEKVPDDMILACTNIKKKWTLEDESALKMMRVSGADELRTNEDVPVQLRKLASVSMSRIDFFYICCTCGKCYWESRAIEKIVKESLKGSEAETSP